MPIINCDFEDANAMALKINRFIQSTTFHWSNMIDKQVTKGYIYTITSRQMSINNVFSLFKWIIKPYKICLFFVAVSSEHQTTNNKNIVFSSGAWAQCSVELQLSNLWIIIKIRNLLNFIRVETKSVTVQ